ncbi:GNAT family N-acetyltransferase [Novosphingobium aquimarinum]|uniref:GNAT family N-acetyltransferase n=1 Tax=Novosphingobium aquimarinum TaxID=2682494 RepID=UPI001E373C9A|nr:GNAT family N-acetyltransferase [Novosphingobium aquimarinum]
MECQPWQDLETEVAAWDALAGRASEPNPFFESWYLLPSLRHLSRDCDVTILRYEEDGQLAGLMPIIRSNRYYGRRLSNISAWLHDNAFCGTPLVARGSETGFWQELLGWADREAGAALFLHLRAMPLDGTLHAALESVAAREARRVALVHHEVRALLESDLQPDAYFETSLSTKKRKELRRQTRRLAEEGDLQVVREQGEQGLQEWLDAFLELERAGWKGESGSALASHGETERLFREALSGAASRGRLERLAVRLDGRAIAMLANFLSPPGAFSYKTAFDETYARFSPGVLLQRENLAMLERPDIAWTDSCASQDHPMIDHFWRERRAIGRLSIAIGGPVRRGAFQILAQVEQARSHKKRD